MLRDWTDSPKFDGLSAGAERLFVRLIMKADDYGRFHAEARRVRSACFPLDNATTKQVTEWLEELSLRKLVILYSVKGEELLSIPSFGQRLQSKRIKFPQKTGESSDWLPIHGDSRESTVTHGDSPPEEKRIEVEEKRKAVEPLALPFTSSEFGNAWAAWLKHLSQKRSKPTEGAISAQLANCQEWGEQRAIAALRHSTAGSYQGLFEPKNHNGQTTDRPSSRVAGTCHEGKPNPY